MAKTKPIGVAYEDQDIIGSDFVYASGELGYTADARGSVTQATNKSTGVTLNTSTGRITMNNAALGAGATALFTLTNNRISANDVVIVNVSNGGTSGAYWPYVASMSNGSVVIGLYNNTLASLSEAVVLNFAVIHCL
jgi:hypothetical protein